MPETVDPRWLLKALAVSVGAAAVLAYLAVCLLIYQGGWQRMLSPGKTVDRTPQAVGLRFDAVRFDAGTTGRPRLAGWWIPAETASAPTILFLHDGTGTMAGPLRRYELLHQSGANVLAFDYRGYGESDGPHPTEARMQEDAAAALDYLVDTRHIRAGSIVPYGQGLGAAIAGELARTHAEVPAIALDDPDPDAFAHVVDEDRSRLLPMRLLVQEHFDLGKALAGSTKPKLLLADGPDGWVRDRVLSNQRFFQTVRDPKYVVTFSTPRDESAYIAALHRFLDEYLPSQGSGL